MSAALRKHFWQARRKCVLAMIKNKPMMTIDIYNNLPMEFICEFDTLTHLMMTLCKKGYCKKAHAPDRRILWTFVRDIDPLPQTKEEIEQSKNVIKQEEWMTWGNRRPLKPMPKDENTTPVYERSQADIAKGIYRAEDRKGRWQVENTTVSKNHVRGSSLSGNSFNVSV